MSSFYDIKISYDEAPSGSKVVHPQGTVAIKDGAKHPSASADETPALKKPPWLKAKLPSGTGYQKTADIVETHGLNTVCKESKCPNIGECWTAGTATFMIMGAVCTRACRFCAVDTGNPNGWLDDEEPFKVAQSVQKMGLRYVVLTSVDRDDLADGGAQHFSRVVHEVKAQNPHTEIEVLTPDFCGVKEHIEEVIASPIAVFAQNVETVERLTHPVRDNRAGYWQTLEVLAYAKSLGAQVTKTSLMVGLGEQVEEVKQTLRDIRAQGVDIVTLGQYLRPTAHHLSIVEYVSLDQFEDYRQYALSIGFSEVVSGPLVRSSYRAERALEKMRQRQTST